MQPTRPPKSQDAALKQLWRQVRASRGTPAPDAGQCAQFLHELNPEARRTLETVLHLAARGREKPGDLGLLSWATACTRPALLERLAAHGLAFSGADLFACGMKLREDGWDVQPRIAQLGNNPGDVDTLRALLPVETGEPEAQALAAPGRPEESPTDEAYFPWPGDGLPDGSAPGWDLEPMDGVPAAPASSRAEVLPSLPTRFERQRPEPFPNSSGATRAESS